MAEFRRPTTTRSGLRLRAPGVTAAVYASASPVAVLPASDGAAALPRLSVVGDAGAQSAQLVRGWSALGELLRVNFDTIPLMQLHRTSDLLVRHRDKSRTALLDRIQDLFGLPVRDRPEPGRPGRATGGRDDAAGVMEATRADGPCAFTRSAAARPIKDKRSRRL